MKLLRRQGHHALPMSPPTRGRGLKLEVALMEVEAIAVAPHAGARIETATLLS